jgi:hypothetical protein
LRGVIPWCISLYYFQTFADFKTLKLFSTISTQYKEEDLSQLYKSMMTLNLSQEIIELPDGLRFPVEFRDTKAFRLITTKFFPILVDAINAGVISNAEVTRKYALVTGPTGIGKVRREFKKRFLFYLCLTVVRLLVLVQPVFPSSLSATRSTSSL